jgi:mRNA interferase MazF
VGAFSRGSVVLVRFPFSDLSHTKLRPAVVLAECGRGDWLLSQITSNPYADPRAVELTDADFQKGSLRLTSYARPAKLFTAHQSLISSEIGVLRSESLARITNLVVELLQSKT